MDDQVPIKITVATVAYNAGTALEKTINSIEQQTYARLEHVIVDGNSHDETLERIHHYQSRNSQSNVRHEINAISEPDDGLYDAMNKAIQMATGDYICFLNAGDVFHDKETVTRVVEALTAEKSVIPGVVYGDTHIVNAEGHFVRKRRLSPPNRLTWKSFRKGMLVCHQSFFANMELARVTPYNLKYRFSADFDWCIRIMRKATAMYMPLVNAHRVISDYQEEGMTTENHKESLWERFRIMALYYGLVTTIVLHFWFLVRMLFKH